MLRAAAWLLLVAVTVNAQLPVGVKHDPCDSHEPTASNQLGCVWGPVGDKLELPQCNYDGEHGLAKRLVEGVEGITAAQKTIQDGFATSILSDAEFAECMTSAFAPSHLHVEPLLAKLKRAILSPKNSPLRNFTAVSSGSSVTAGHDNLYKQGWVFAFERAASCGFAAAGLNLIARNAALGANQGLQYSVCAPTVYGNDADLVMAEMNAMMGEDKPYDREVLVRNVYDPHQFPRRPFLLDAGAGGVSSGKIWGDVTPECQHDQHTKKCPVDAIMSSLCISPKCKAIPCEDDHGKYSCDSIEAFASTFEVRLSKQDETLYTKYAAYGNAVYTPITCIVEHAKKWEFTGSALLRMGKQLNQGKGWHFGPYGHDLYGRLIAHWLLEQLKKALQDISTAAPAGLSASDLKSWADGYATGLAEPPTTLLDKEFCSAGQPYCQERSQCATLMEPHWTHEFTDQSGEVIVPTHKPQSEPEALILEGHGNGQHGVVVRPGSDDLNGWAVLLKASSAPLIDMRIACSPFSNCPALLQNASEHQQYYDIGQVMHVLDSGHWAVTLVEQSASRNEVLMAFDGGWGWKDRKYVLTGNNGSGTLELTLTAKQSYDGFMVCDAPFCSKASPGTGCDHYRMPLAVPGVLALEVDGKDVSDKIHKHGAGPEIRKLESVSRNNKEQYNMCLWVAHPMGPGEHTLGLKVTSKEMIYVGHIVWW